MMKLPSLPVVTGEISMEADTPAFVVVFREYIWMVAPEIGDCPPCTTPEICGETDSAGAGDCRSPMEHPDKKMEIERKAKETAR